MVSREGETTFATVLGQELSMDEPAVETPRNTHRSRHDHGPSRAWFNPWRGGGPAFVLQAMARADCEADVAIVRSDGFDLSHLPELVPQLADPAGNNPYGAEHQLAGDLPLAYLATGDARMRATIEDYGEDILDHMARGEFAFPETRDDRAWLRRFENLAGLCEFTGDDHYRAEVLDGVDQVIDQVADGAFSSLGRDPNRGFLYKGDLDESGELTGLPTQRDHPRVVHAVFGADISGATYDRVLSALTPMGDTERLDELRDALLGHARFLQGEVGRTQGIFDWFGEDYCLDSLPDPNHPAVQGGSMCTNEPDPLTMFADSGINPWTRHALRLYDTVGDAAALDDAWAVWRARALWLGMADELSDPQLLALMEPPWAKSQPSVSMKAKPS